MVKISAFQPKILTFPKMRLWVWFSVLWWWWCFSASNHRFIVCNPCYIMVNNYYWCFESTVHVINGRKKEKEKARQWETARLDRSCGRHSIESSCVALLAAGPWWSDRTSADISAAYQFKTGPATHAWTQDQYAQESQFFILSHIAFQKCWFHFQAGSAKTTSTVF